MADAGTFEYWQAGEQPPQPPESVDSGTFEYWQAGEQPPILDTLGGAVVRTLATTGAGR